MTDIDLDAIRARADAASDGPWIAVTDTGRKNGMALIGRKVDRGTGKAIAVFAEASANRHADAAFAAAARTDVPTLLARLAEVEAERDAARSQVGFFAANWGSLCRLLGLPEESTGSDVLRLLNEQEARADAYRADFAAAVAELDGKGPCIGMADLQAAEANLAAMRPVVEAAEAYRAAVALMIAVQPEMAETFHPVGRAVVDAVDAYRAAQKAPLDRPESRQGDERAEPAVASTDTAQAQRGVQNGAEAFGIDHPTHPGYWIEVDPSGWPHQRIAVTPGYRVQWVPWMSDSPVPPFPRIEELVRDSSLGAALPADPPGLDAAIEARCGHCGGPNRPWSAPSPLWNLVMRGGSIGGTEPHDGIICPTCFMVLAGDMAELWRLDAQRVRPVLETTLPDGRRWNSATWLWEESSS